MRVSEIKFSLSGNTGFRDLEILQRLGSTSETWKYFKDLEIASETWNYFRDLCDSDQVSPKYQYVGV